MIGARVRSVESAAGEPSPGVASVKSSVLGYAAMGCLWIVGSGWVTHRWVLDDRLGTGMEMASEVVFVLVSAWWLRRLLLRNQFAIEKTAGELRASERRLTMALDAAQLGTFDWDMPENRLIWSHWHERLWGFAPGEFDGSYASFEKNLHPDDRVPLRGELERCSAGRTPFRREFRVVWPDGGVRWVGAAGEFEYDPSGRAVRMHGVVMDLTERKRTEEELRQSLMLRREAEKIARIGAWKVSPKTNYLYWTEGVYDIVEAPLDYRPGLQEGLSLYFPESVPILSEALERAWADGVPFVIEAGLTTMRGKKVWTEVRGLGRLHDGEQSFVMGTFQDITARKDAERAMREGEEQLRQAQKLEAIGQLAGGVAHDFNNILAAIMMQLGLLQLNSSLKPEARQALEDLTAEVRRGADLTRQLLMFSRRSVLSMKTVDPNDLVSNLLKMLRRLIGEPYELRFEPMTQPYWVEADAGMIEQVVMNLVVNARDAMPEGGRITIRTTFVELTAEALHVHAHASARPGCFVCLEVEDVGCGMEPAILERIFQPFFTTKEPGKGTGLGLATVHGIVSQHTGWVEVRSVVGKGSSFRVLLPAAAQAPSQPRVLSPEVVVWRGHETILLVEDEWEVRRLVGQSLRAFGYTVHEASQGREALALWSRLGGRVDLVLTDMVMPGGMTGLELVQNLRGLKPELLAIVTSGYSTEMVQAGLLNLNGVSYLPKPFEAPKLAEEVRNRLDAGMGAEKGSVEPCCGVGGGRCVGGGCEIDSADDAV